MRGDRTAARHLLLRELIGNQKIDNQETLGQLLAQQGHKVTQATISRDLSTLGAIKVVNAEDHEYYQISAQSQTPGHLSLVLMMRQFVRAINHSGNLAVLKTSPGGSGPVAAAIDDAELEPVIATLAGDDTILVVAQATDGGEDLAQLLKTIMENNG